MEVHNNYNLIPILRYITLVLLCLALTAKAGAADDVLKPNYDNVEQKLKFLDDRKSKHPLFLSCNITISTDQKLSWTRNGTDIASDTQLKDRFQIIDAEHKLIIKHPSLDDVGLYTCSIPGHKAEIHLIATVYLKKTPNNINVVEGERLQIHCKTFGTDPVISWKIGGNETFNRTHIQFKEDEDSVKDAILFIEHVELTDRNTYNCAVRNIASVFFNETVFEVTMVRVKGKLAALWPFLGICAEVIILCAIILIYEKRRNTENLEESDTDQSPEQEKLKTGK